MTTFRTESAEETEQLGGRLAATLGAGDVVAVSGELGAGKTTFIRGACHALGVDGPVTSPTFTIAHLYEAPVPVAHLDLYRLEKLSDQDWDDLGPYFDGTIVFVEWPEHAATRLRLPHVAVSLEHLDASCRRVTIGGGDDLDRTEDDSGL